MLSTRHRNRLQQARRARRGLLGAAALTSLAAGLLTAAPASAVNYVTSANGAEWQIADSAAPGLDTGSLNTVGANAVYGFGGIRVAVDSSPAPRFNGELMRGFGLRFDGLDRFTTTRAVPLGDVAIERDLTIRRSDDYARFVDTFSNAGERDVTVDVAFGGVLGLARGTTQSAVAATSSGDTAIGTDDAWAAFSTPTPGWSSNSPSAVVLGTPAPFAGFLGVGDFQRDPFLTPLATSGQEANFYGFTDQLTLRPGQTRSIVRFFAVGLRETSGTAGQQVTAVTQTATDLTATPDFGGLSTAQICSIANWDVAALTIPDFDAAGCAAVRPLDVPAPRQQAQPTTSSSYDVVGKSIAELQADLEAGATTSQEITRAYLDRIAAYDTGQFGFHAYIHVAEDAMAQAKAADEARAAGKRSPVLGIPVAIKDLYNTKDMPTTDGTYALHGYQPSTDAFQVAKLREAGAIVIGKANLSQFANSGSMSESSYGQVWNAFKPSKSSLGSSGGSAVAVAASMAGFAMGTQTGVSLYAPSTGAGLATFRGTDGMQSAGGVMPLTWATDYAGAMARTVTDLAGILNVVAGTDPRDELTRDADVNKPADWTEHLDADALRGKTIGYLPAAFDGYARDDGTAAATRDKLAVFEQLGATVVEMDGQPSQPANGATGGSANVEGWERYIADNPEFPFADARGILQSPRNLPYNRTGGTQRPYDDENSARLLEYRAAYRQVIGDWMDARGVDAIVYPGFLSDVWDNDGARTHNGSDRATGVITQGPGLPTAIVPVGFNPHGDPMTMQLVGREWADPEILGMGYALEQATGERPQATTAPALAYEPGATPEPVVIEVPAQPETTPQRQAAPENAQPPATPAAPVARQPVARQPVVSQRITIKSGAFARVRGGRVRVAVRNTGRATITGLVTLRAKAGRRTVVLGSGRVNVAAGKATTVTIRLTRRASVLLGRRARVVATATYSLRNPTGASATRRAKLTIRLR